MQLKVSKDWYKSGSADCTNMKTRVQSSCLLRQILNKFTIIICKASRQKVLHMICKSLLNVFPIRLIYRTGKNHPDE